MRTNRASEPSTAPGPSRRWYRRRPLLFFGVGLGVLILLAVGTDLIIAQQMKGRVVEAVRCAIGNDIKSPEVSMGRTPAVVQLISGEIGRVQIADVPMAAIQAANDKDPGSLGTQNIDLTLHGVKLGDMPSVKSLDAQTVVNWDSLTERMAGSTGQLAGSQLGEEDGMLSVTLAQQMMGQPLKVLMTVTTEASSLVMTPETVVIGDRRLQASLLAGRMGTGGDSPLAARSVDLELPEGTSLSSASVEPDGMAVKMAIDTNARRSANAEPGCQA